MTERVAITGVGVVSPVGVGYQAFGDALLTGRSGVRTITAFCVEAFPTRIAAEVDASWFDPVPLVEPPKAVKLMSRAALFAVAAARLARSMARLGMDDVPSERVGVSLGAAGMGPTDNDLIDLQVEAALDAGRQSRDGRWNIAAFAAAYRRRTNPVASLRALPNVAAAHVAIQQSARGPNSTITTACTAGTQAIGDGMRMIQRGDADVVLAGGTDATVNPVAVLGFSLLGTLSMRNDMPAAASRPFDRDRDGFVVGEGAAILVLERESFARARGATVLAELAGYAATCDAYRITDERPDAAGAANAINGAMRDAGASIADVRYVNAHGTGTRMNDLTESVAIRRALGPATDLVPVSSTKSMTGHLLAAAGAVEAAACIVAMERGMIPPTINLDHPDPECDLCHVRLNALAHDVPLALSNSFGFGGQNACLLIRRW